MCEYINPNSYTVHLVGQQGEQIQVRPGQKIILNEYFDRYQTRGFIKRADRTKPEQTDKLMQKRMPKHVRQIQVTKTQRKLNSLPIPAIAPPIPAVAPPIPAIVSPTQIKPLSEPPKPNPPKETDKKQSDIRSLTSQTVISRAKDKAKHRIVGRQVRANASELLRINLDRAAIPISNNIGIGILSYNRKNCLKRLIESIVTNTNLQQTTIFVSDDHSTDQATLRYLDEVEHQGNIVVLRNKRRLGIAGNSNRLIRCLSRFKYGMILNDDVEVLRPEWEHLYPNAMIATNMHHFMYRQAGVYGATRGNNRKVNGKDLLFVEDRPHGAVLAFTHEMLVKCGYFDESYGIYGMEHIDWSQRAWELSLQPFGFWDVAESDQYFKIHSDPTVVSNKGEHLQHARELFKKRVPGRVGPTENSRVPEISYIIPFRNTDRESAIKTVVQNIRAQRFPVIHILLMEQDKKCNIDIDAMRPASYQLVINRFTDLFNKSQAFNVGVSKSITDKIVLHDADMLVQGDYTQCISDALDEYEACHMGKMVLYADKSATDKICARQIVDKDIECDRIVGYFEGGSLACTKQAYWRVGAFCEDFWGYGVEDCDFYARISYASKWLENRKFDFLHLHHGRAPNWDDHHKENIAKGKRMEHMSIAKRVEMQYARLQELGWQAEISAIGEQTKQEGLDFYCIRDGNRTVKIFK